MNNNCFKNNYYFFIVNLFNKLYNLDSNNKGRYLHMNNKNKKGFTLVELLAVIVVLIVISIIAINKVSDIIKRSNINTVKANGTELVKIVEQNASESRLTGNFKDGMYTLSEIFDMGLNLSGTKPTSGVIIIADGRVAYSCLAYEKYYYRNMSGDITINKTKCDNNITLGAEYSYTGHEERFKVTVSGTYKVEAWGAQGGNTSTYNYKGGYGGYSAGEVNLKSGDILYINVGGQGEEQCYNKSCAGGYNGGGASGWYTGGTVYSSGGGGASHVALKSGLLSTLESDINSILIVAGGGGGATYHNNTSTFGFSHDGGSGGGITGYGLCGANDLADSGSSSGCGGSQTATGAVSNTTYGTYGSFGLGASNTCSSGGSGSSRKCYASGAGGGFYGGSTGNHGVAGGGSGYIGNSKLDNKVMYCYNCAESSNSATKTISTTCNDSTSKEKCAKSGNGYVKISYVVNGEPLEQSILSKYTQVEYIESTGTQYIDLNYAPKSNTKIIADLSFNGTFKPYSTYGGSSVFLGVSDSNSGASYYINFGDDSNQGNTLYIWNNKDYGVDNAPVQELVINDSVRTGRNTLTLDTNKFTYGTFEKNLVTKETNNTASMYIFGGNTLYDANYRGAFNSYNMKLYNLKIYEGTNIVHDYKPCYKGSDIGLCDTIENKYYGNSGSGTFNKGNTI